MANVLIEENTLSAIGNAIRAKTGKTDLILPSDMATEIAKITGGGGDSSELYWKEDISFPTCQKQSMCPFVFEGKWYVILYIYNSSTKIYEGKVYLRVGDTFEYVCDYGGGVDLFYAYGIVEYNGKVHFIGGSGKSHFTWDGINEWKTLNSLPYSSDGDCIVFNGGLYITCSSSGKIAKYIENDDSWEIVSTSPKTMGHNKLFEYNSKLFASSYDFKYLYEITADGAIETNEIDFTSLTFRTNTVDLFNVGGKLFALYNRKNGCAVYQNGEWAILPNTPTYDALSKPFFIFNNKVYMMRFSNSNDKERIFYLRGI